MSIFLETLRLNPLSFDIGDKIVKVHGPDALAYLHSQTTNDVQALASGEFHFNTVLDLSGKIITAFLLCKKSEVEFYLCVSSEFIDKTIERIEKFHIAEDFDVTVLDQKTSLICNENHLEGAFTGSYFFSGDQIVFAEKSNYNSQEEYNLLKILTGTPEFGIEVNPNELINNTQFDTLAVNYQKGCYPGQETVSKINSRRGAAYKPVLLELEQEVHFEKGSVLIDDKKVGEIRSAIAFGGKSYCYCLLSRESRIENSELTFSTDNHKNLKALVKYYPFLKPDKKQLANDLFDQAVELFHNDDNEQAKNYFQKAIDIDPAFEDAYESLGVLHGRLEQYETAIELMEKLKEINPKSMMAHTNLSLYHMKIGNIEIAEKYKADATVLNFQYLGDEAKIKKEKEAIEQKRIADIQRREGMFLQVLDMDPEDAMANNGMGEILFDRKQYDLAVDYFKKAITADKKYSVAHLGLAKSLYQLQRTSELREVLLNGISIASKNGDLMPANEMQSILSKIQK